MTKRDRLLCLIEVASDLGVGSGEPDDYADSEYTRGCVELIAKTFWSEQEFDEAKSALLTLFYKLNGEE